MAARATCRKRHVSVIFLCVIVTLALYEITANILHHQRTSATADVAQKWSECHQRSDCSSCAFASPKCVWCAASSKCTSISDQASCSDLERGHCSSIILFDIPARLRVIYVGKRSGGPEALVQLHLALRHWGFRSTQETRRKQVGKKLLPFFQSAYADEFNRLGGVQMQQFSDYRAFLASAQPADVIILTETWPCQRGLRFDSRRSARQLQFHLTIQDRQSTYNISHMYIPDALPEECAVFTHTHFMTHTFLNQSSKATITPYVSPHIEKLASNDDDPLASLRHVILYDGDAQFDPSKVDPDLRGMLVKAASIKPTRLYRLYRAAICVVDFGMPGAERLVLEASLFGTPVVINDELNGADVSDFPVPPRFRISGRNYTQLNVALREMVAAVGTAKWGALVSEYSHFRAYVAHLRTRFYRDVRRYFSDSAHFVIKCTTVRRESAEMVALKHAIASILVHLPFAIVTVIFSDATSKRLFLTAEENFVRNLERHYLSSSVSFVERDVQSPPHVLFRIDVLSRNCFVVSHDFISTVSVVFDASWNGKENFKFDISNCFRVTLNSGRPRRNAGFVVQQLNVDEQHTMVKMVSGIFTVSRHHLASSPLVSQDALWNSIRGALN